MCDVSHRLRRARERAGLDIKAISARTKIKPAFLEAIEQGNFEKLPGDFFTRAFLKAYAREVGLSPDEIAQEYDDSYMPDEPEELHVPPVERLNAGRGPAWNFDLSMLPLPRGVWSIAAVVTTILIITSVTNRPETSSHPEPAAVGTTGVAEAANPSATVPAQATSTPDKLRLDIRPTATLWVAATADGERVLYRMLEPGEHVTLEAMREFAFRIGNAVAFEYSINGIPGKPLGGPDEVLEFQITPDNYRTYRR